MATEPQGNRLKRQRKRLRLAQSTVAAYVAVKTRVDYNQGRISEMENDLRPPTPEEVEIITDFYEQVEELRRQQRHWSAVFDQ